MDFIIGAIIGYLARDESLKRNETFGRFLLRCLGWLVFWLIAMVIGLFVIVTLLDFLVGLAPSNRTDTP